MEDKSLETAQLQIDRKRDGFFPGSYLGPQAGRAQISTRVRLADSQKIIAIARLSDGSFWSVSADVVVTLAACTEEVM